MDRDELYETLDDAVKKGQNPYGILRNFSLDAVADILLHVPPKYEAVRRALPSMAADDVQDSWTGSHGYTLLLSSCAFVRALENGFVRHTGRLLDDAQILDYGCGWGRLVRLMYKYTAPENLYGCDPWDKSIELCRENNLAGNFSISEYIPTKAPFPGKKFDLIYAFSVFTHLSDRSGKAVMKACRESIKDDGLMVLTIRPFSYWDVHDPAQSVVDVQAMKAAHKAHGFAFTPHGRKPVDNDITYGDTSISLDYIRENWAGWQIAGVDYLLQDPYQTMVYLKPVGHSSR